MMTMKVVLSVVLRKIKRNTVSHWATERFLAQNQACGYSRGQFQESLAFCAKRPNAE